MKTFHQWKIDQLAADKNEHDVTFIREKDWYWAAYGRYCNKFRNKEARI